MENKVIICLNCKDIWISPMRQCTCGHKMFDVTDESNRPLANNYQVEKLLKEFGFKRDMYNHNFSFTTDISKIIDVDMLHGELSVSITDINDNTIWLEFIDTPEKLESFLKLLN